MYPFQHFRQSQFLHAGKIGADGRGKSTARGGKKHKNHANSNSYALALSAEELEWTWHGAAGRANFGHGMLAKKVGKLRFLYFFLSIFYHFFSFYIIYFIIFGEQETEKKEKNRNG